MKKTLVRDNQRKLFNHAPVNKAAHSQSPTHKKLIKKIELTQREAPNQYDLSLQDDFFAQRPQEEVVDFRVEIERRFKKSTANSTFKFPLRDIESNESDSSINESFESIRHATVYELNSQNFKRMKAAKQTHKGYDERTTNGRTFNGFFTKDKEVEEFEDFSQDDSSEGNLDRDDPNLPIEIRIQDKNSNTYKKFISILEKQLNKAASSAQLNPKAAYIPSEQLKEDSLESYKHQQQQFQSKQIQRDSKLKRPTTNMEVKKNNLVRDESQKSLGYYVGKLRTSDFDSKARERPETTNSFQSVKKITKGLDLSQKIKNVHKNSQLNDTNTQIEGLMNLDSRLSPSMKRTMEEANRVAEAKKKVNNIMSSSSILRSISPNYASTKTLSTWKDVADKSITKTPVQRETPFSPSVVSSTLYQKAKDDVLSGKLQVNQLTSQLAAQKKKSSGTTVQQIQKVEKNDLSKSPPSIKAINFSSFYGSPKSQITKPTPTGNQNIYTNLSKGRDIRNEREVGNKSSERQLGHISYEIASKKGQSKPAFKLDLSNRFQKQKDLLSSTRGNMAKEKSSELLSIDSILKTSYDMQNHSLMRNTSSKTDLTKKRISGGVQK